MKIKENNILQKKSYDFSLRIIKLFLYLKDKKVDISLCRQLLRSGTSIGANTAEAMSSYSKKEFVMKVQIAYKEAKETEYWLNLLKDSKLIEEKLAFDILNDCEEILKITTKVLKSSKLTINS